MTDMKKTLYAFWSGFGIPAYLADSVPSEAEYPYITYEAVRGAGLGWTILTATAWYAKLPNGNSERTELMDKVAKAIPEGGVKLPCGSGFVALYRNDDNFLSDTYDGDNSKILGGRVSYRINYYV